MNHFCIKFREQKNQTIHSYCFFSVFSNVPIEDVLTMTIPGDTTKRYIFQIKNKALDEGIYKVEKNIALWKMIEARLNDLSALFIHPVTTIMLKKQPELFEQLYGTFFIEIADKNPALPI